MKKEKCGQCGKRVDFVFTTRTDFKLCKDCNLKYGEEDFDQYEDGSLDYGDYGAWD